MDDRFLDQLKDEPPASLTRDLRQRLARNAPETSRAPRLVVHRGPVLWLAASAAVIAAVVFFPSVRIAAQGFLDLFRVRNFAAVKVDPARLEMLKDQKVGLDAVLGTPTVVRDPGPPRAFANAGEASAFTGYALRMPTDIPGAYQVDTVLARGESEQRARVDGARLRSALTSLGIDDLTIPPVLDGAEVSVRIAPVAIVRYAAGDKKVMFLQSPSPEIGLPPGVDFAQMGEIGLRVAGLSPAEARRFASTIDWHSTVLVPVPAGARSFTEVDVRGNKGLLVSSSDSGPKAEQRKGTQAQLMWADDGRVFALVTSSLNEVDLVRMANSVQ